MLRVEQKVVVTVHENMNSYDSFPFSSRVVFVKSRVSFDYLLKS